MMHGVPMMAYVERAAHTIPHASKRAQTQAREPADKRHAQARKQTLDAHVEQASPSVGGRGRVGCGCGVDWWW
jgi:hypothetical protein